MKPRSFSGNLWYSSDYRKAIALDGSLRLYYASRDKSQGYSAGVSPIFRMNNHFTVKISASYEKLFNNYGFAAFQNERIIFGSRDIRTIENSVSGKYLLKNDVSLSMVARHYTALGKYNNFYELHDDGSLLPVEDYNRNHDFIFNTFNIDMVFTWIFAPGSSLNLVWKNEITDEKNTVTGNYFSQLDDTFKEPQLNNISLKILYYIDYQRLRK